MQALNLTFHAFSLLMAIKQASRYVMPSVVLWEEEFNNVSKKLPLLSIRKPTSQSPSVYTPKYRGCSVV
jgi:hypothetical protein